jgi:hypothetical protein
VPQENAWLEIATAGDAVIVSTEAANKNGSVDLENFEMVNIALSPSYDDRESEVAQKVLGQPSLKDVFYRSQ